jgi:hypothetical protein
MNGMIRPLFGLILLLVSACSSVPFTPTELTSAVPRTAHELTAKSWNSGTGSVMIRQSALFEFEGMQVPIAGIMKLDLAAKYARLVGMNDMGVKLYDISVDSASSQAHFIIPDLAGYPGFAEAVAVSVRRIFLSPQPALDDSLELTPTSYLFKRESSTNGGTTRFILGGADAQLLEKSFCGPTEAWNVRYYLYQHRQGRLFPGGIVLDDRRAGYRLTLWIESVENADE